MSVGFRIAIATICSALAISDAIAFCAEPSPPDDGPQAPSTFSKPSAPFCLQGYRVSGEHSCERWEIDGYISEVEYYIRDLKTYVADASDFADEAIEFANAAAAAYAKCERDDAAYELE